MSLRSTSAGIFALILLLLLIAAVFPTPTTIGIASILSAALVMLQAFLILKDQQ